MFTAHTQKDSLQTESLKLEHGMEPGVCRYETAHIVSKQFILHMDW